MFANNAKIQIKLEAIDYYHTPTGLIDGYITRGIDANLFDFRLRVLPTKEFQPFETSSIVSMAKTIPKGSLYDEVNYLYVWQDTNDQVVREVWRKTIHAIITNLVVRPGLDRAILMSCLVPAVPLRDLTVALQWLIDNGTVYEGSDALWLRDAYWRVYI